jgi:plasmid stabilization system protein ParE
MKRTLRFHPSARAEYDAEYIYYLDEGMLEKADEFEDEIEKSLDRITAHPSHYRRILDQFRSYGPTKKFKYRIAYLIRPESIFVVAVYYSGAADPLYWSDRYLD